MWELRRFESCLQDWFAIDDPALDVRRLAVEWAISRSVDPYQGAQRETSDGKPNHWVAALQAPQNDLVVAEFDILELDHAVECTVISTLPASVLGMF